jgi:hypothetical protein
VGAPSASASEARRLFHVLLVLFSLLPPALFEVLPAHLCEPGPCGDVEEGDLLLELVVLLPGAVAQNNLGNGLEAITGLPISEFMRDVDIRKIGLLSVKESYRIIKKAGLHPGPLQGLMAPVLLLARVPLPVGVWMLRKRHKITASHSIRSRVYYGSDTRSEYSIPISAIGLDA